MNAPGHPTPYGAPAAAKKSGNRGCWIALAVVGGLGLLAVIAIAIGIYALAQNKELRKVASAVGEGMEIMKDAQNAPGTSELRKLGCDQAMVLDMVRAAKLADDFVDGGTSLPPDMPTKYAMCIVQSARGAPSCGAVSKTYFGAVPKPVKRFAVAVEVQNRERPECSELYAPDGKLLGIFDTASAPPIPTAQP